jgi:hypothetical protein
MVPILESQPALMRRLHLAVDEREALVESNLRIHGFPSDSMRNILPPSLQIYTLEDDLIGPNRNY